MGTTKVTPNANGSITGIATTPAALGYSYFKSGRLKAVTAGGSMDQLNRRYGADTVQLGVMPKTSAGHVGTKIAFGRIPSASEFAGG